ncbi:hypothetical protein [Thiocystis minor]|uniref:hypothetical protein n=1 Tax=Thiocystis minor TaxID=61597 RepID=UPI001913C81D|nr:hypothetical protein [Thiocystis minor]
MLIDLIEQYSAIVQSWTVTNFDREGEDFRLKGAELALVLEEIALSIDTYGHSSR